jgi:uncharacterized protein involved in type VI secretion and phage assembly
MNALQVVTAVMHEAGLSNVETRVAAALPTEEMIVQYQENDLAFITRLLEQAGIHYHIEVSSGGDRVVLSDGNAGFPILPAGKLIFATSANPAVSAFTRGQSMHSGQIQAGVRIPTQAGH